MMDLSIRSESYPSGALKGALTGALIGILVRGKGRPGVIAHAAYGAVAGAGIVLGMGLLSSNTIGMRVGADRMRSFGGHPNVHPNVHSSFHQQTQWR